MGTIYRGCPGTWRRKMPSAGPGTCQLRVDWRAGQAPGVLEPVGDQGRVGWLFWRALCGRAVDGAEAGEAELRVDADSGLGAGSVRGTGRCPAL